MRLLRRLWFVITRRQQDDDLAAELEFHRQMKADELRASGLSEPDARIAAQRALGNDVLARERSRDVWIWPWLQDITQDVKFGARMLARDRRFTVAAVIALGLGIGINNSVFTIMNTALLRELPFEDAHRLVEARIVDARGREGQVSYADFLDWSASATSFEGLMADVGTTMNVSGGNGSAERFRGAYVTANTFRLLRVAPFLGRDFVADDDRPGAPAVIMLAYDAWQSRYGGEPSIVGQTIRVNSETATVIGVMPRGVTYPAVAQMWRPLSSATNLNRTERAARTVGVSGRLAPGVSMARAQADLDAIAAQIAQAHPAANKELRVRVMSLHESYSPGDVAWRVLGTLMGAVTFVLLIACANVASLLLARSTHRSREMAIRSSLGASRWRIIRQLLIECLLVSVRAAAVGLSLSRFLASIMSNAFNIFDAGAPGSVVRPFWADISVDTSTLTFLGALCLFASIAVGLVPSWHLSRTNANDVLKDGGRGGGATRRARRMSGVLLVGQLALTVILLGSAGLMVRAYVEAQYADLVLDTRGVVTMRIVLPVPKYAAVERQRQFIAELDQRLTAVPSFSSATIGSDIPLHPLGFGGRSLTLDGRPWPTGEDAPEVQFTSVGPRYFETLGIAVVRGRAFTPFDGLRGQEGAIVNERFVAQYFAGADPIGQRIKMTGPAFTADQAPWMTVVGVAQGLPNFIVNNAAGTDAMVYLPIGADPAPQRALSIVVRAADAASGKAEAAAALRTEVGALDPDLPVFGIQTLEEAVATSRVPRRIFGSWFLTIAIAALILSTVGLYALTAHGVAQRSHEIGVRMALGARSQQVIWMFVRRTVVQLTIGLALGLAGLIALGRLLMAIVRDERPGDPLTLTVVTLLLVSVALVASIWPARRAARVDPATVLRGD